MKSLLLYLLVVFVTSPIVAQKNNAYEVYAIQFAQVTEYWPAKNIAINPTVNDSVKGIFMIWLLKGNNNRNILVDAGFHRESKFFGHWLQDFVRPDSSLEKVGLKPEDITDVIISHPHWDHAGGVDLFPKAIIWMQKNDYSYFVTDAWQKGGNTVGFDSLDVPKIAGLNAKGKIQLVNGDAIEIIPGITVYTGSKHTYESQYVVVNTATDKVLIASDNCWFYYNLNHMISIPLTFDAKAYVNALQRMKTLVDPGLIIPGHDSKVFEKFTKVKEGVVRIR
jgi:glyoxylase-like metal-dependent hydrolase (beta-lactamase superfamily II)